jgi:hypothetical protein
MADGGATFYYYLAAAAGTAITVQDQRFANEVREQQLEEELRTKGLAALDEENERLRSLSFANEELMVNAGGVDAFASPSLIAARNFNFRIGMEDITNIRLNLQTARSGIAARIGILKHNSRAVLTAGIFDIAGIAIGGFDALGQLGKPKLLQPLPVGGTGGANAIGGIGHLDLPGANPAQGILG